MAGKKTFAPFRVILDDEDLGVFDYSKITVQLGILIEENTGLGPLEIVMNLMKPSGQRALVWWMWHQRGKHVQLGDVVFDLSALDIQPVTEAPKDEALSESSGGSISDSSLTSSTWDPETSTG